MYVKSMKDDYTLFDAFNFLGMRLYGAEWTGYEVRREREDDPAPTLQTRAPLEAKAEQLASLYSDKLQEQKKVEGREEIRRVNNDIDNLRRAMSDNYHQLHQIEDVHDFKIKDYETWVRFEKAEGKFLKALCNDEIRVVCLFGQVVKPDLWAEMPEGFGYDLEHSLIFWPSSESSKQMASGRIRKLEFETWLETVIPIVPHDDATITTEQKAHIRLKELVQAWDGRTKRDQFKEIIQGEFPDLGARAFKRIWDAESSPEMKRPGAKKST